ncbi:MAG: HAMP domain-containing protein [Ketobacter sp.]|nr:MAG: HAMP domain-containing protein [Ketobacter sp.]
MPKLTFGQKIFFSILSVAGLCVLLIGLPSVFNTAEHYMQIAKDQVRTDSVMVASMVGPALVFEREDMAESILDILEQSPQIISATVYVLNPLDGALSSFATYGDTMVATESGLIQSTSTQVERIGGNLVAVTPVLSSDEIIGYVQLVASLSNINQHFQQTLLYVAIAGALALLVAGYLAVASRRAIVRPIIDLNTVSRLIAETKDYGKRAKAESQDEVGDLIESFNSMLDVIQEYDLARKEKEQEILQLNRDLERKVNERTMELQNSMVVLSDTVENLRNTQTKLVEQEKMASLGGLVAGVAHEINTPIGVGITASSHLSQSIRELSDKFEKGSLTKRDFAEAINEMKETVHMIGKNLERSAALVKSFKMVAVDQTSDDMRSFNVKEYFESVLMSLKPKLKRTRHHVVLDIPENLTVLSSPGALSQIITNLIMNSLQHGFELVEEGEIKMQVQQDDDGLVFDYFDNGKGIADEIRERIFDPFVTTARSKGGSGLGTHILYNLVTQVLSGTVVLIDDGKQGVHFRICFPVDVRAEDDSVATVGVR